MKLQLLLLVSALVAVTAAMPYPYEADPTARPLNLQEESMRHPYEEDPTARPLHLQEESMRHPYEEDPTARPLHLQEKGMRYPDPTARPLYLQEKGMRFPDPTARPLYLQEKGMRYPDPTARPLHLQEKGMRYPDPTARPLYLQEERFKPTVASSQQSLISAEIGVPQLNVGQTVEAVYISPNEGRVFMNFMSAQDDYILHVDARFQWGSYNRALVINSKTAEGSWSGAREMILYGVFPFPCDGVQTEIRFTIEVGKSSFIISANDRQITTFAYVPIEGLIPENVAKIEWGYQEYSNALKIATLKKMSVTY